MLATNMGFNAANNVAFRKAFRYLRRDVRIPSPGSLRIRLLNRCQETEENIMANIPPNAKVSIAVDAWTSPNKLAFLGVVMYYITDTWELKEVLIGFEEIHGSHTGANMAGIIERILRRYKIEDWLLGFTTDSASNNKTLSKTLAEALGMLSIDWEPEKYHIPCMAHVVQLILGAFMKELKIKVKEEKMPSGFKDTYIDKIRNMDRGFYKTVEKVCFP
jgi:hypothetical protein